MEPGTTPTGPRRQPTALLRKCEKDAKQSSSAACVCLQSRWLSLSDSIDQHDSGKTLERLAHLRRTKSAQESPQPHHRHFAAQSLRFLHRRAELGLTPPKRLEELRVLVRRE